MTKSISLRLLSVTVAIIVIFALSITPVLAHDGVDHEAEARIEKMETIVGLLEQLRDLLEMQVAQLGMTPMSHDDMHDEDMMHDEHDMDLSGIHIMADGSVMLGNGETLHDATVNEEGMIVLADGTEVEPTMDMRSGQEHEEHEHGEMEEGLSIRFEIHDGMTHVHYTAEDGEYTEFFVDADIADEDAVIAAIVAETGLDQQTVEDVADFQDVIVWD